MSDKKKLFSHKIEKIIYVLVVLTIFIYMYGFVYKRVTSQYLIRCIIFSAIAVFFVGSYIHDPLEWNKSILVAFVIAMIVRTFIFQNFMVPTGSMEPALHGDPINGDRVLVNKFIYHFKQPKRGDIVVFRTVNMPGLDGRKDYIKRCVALPGENVEIRHESLKINDKKVNTPEVFQKIDYKNTYRFNRGGLTEGQYGMRDKPVQVPKNCFYVLGDNSRSSRDSRYWGFVPKENLMGQAVMIFWPLKRFRLFKTENS